jgi:hypothetical protein
LDLGPGLRARRPRRGRRQWDRHFRRGWTLIGLMLPQELHQPLQERQPDEDHEENE